MTTNTEKMDLATAFTIVICLARQSAFTKTQVGASPELNAAMLKEQEAIDRIDAVARSISATRVGGHPDLTERVAPYIERSSDTMEGETIQPAITNGDPADARLENWTTLDRPKGKDGFILVGEIYGDKKGRFNDGATVFTSVVNWMDESAGLAKTRNSTYALGKRAELRR